VCKVCVCLGLAAAGCTPQVNCHRGSRKGPRLFPRPAASPTHWWLWVTPGMRSSLVLFLLGSVGIHTLLCYCFALPPISCPPKPCHTPRAHFYTPLSSSSPPSFSGALPGVNARHPRPLLVSSPLSSLVLPPFPLSFVVIFPFLPSHAHPDPCHTPPQPPSEAWRGHQQTQREDTSLALFKKLRPALSVRWHKTCSMKDSTKNGPRGVPCNMFCFRHISFEGTQMFLFESRRPLMLTPEKTIHRALSFEPCCSRKMHRTLSNRKKYSLHV
jgi:hypothetical protein